MNRVEQTGKESVARSAAGVMDQIAGRVGCSKSTVSRVLSGKGKNFSVRPELREAILRTADELEYRPNPFLQMMRSRESKIVAVFDPVRDASETIREAKESFIRRIGSSGYVATPAAIFWNATRCGSTPCRFRLRGRCFSTSVIPRS